MVALSRAVVFVTVLGAALLQTLAIRHREVDALDTQAMDAEAAPVFADEEVHMALLAEIRSQLIAQQKALQDTVSDRQGKESVRSHKQRLLNEEGKMGWWTNMKRKRFWSDYYPSLERAIRGLNQDINTLKASERKFQNEVAELTKKLDSSAEDAEAALQALIAENNAQIASKEELLMREAMEGERERVEQQSKAKFKEDGFSETIQEIQAEIKAVKEQLKLLRETHSSSLCSEKEGKGERICKRCSEGTAACGKWCLAAGEACFHDAGCACDEAPASLLQLGDAHPIHERINNAKAALRKAINAHGIAIDSFSFNIKTEELSLEDKKLEKAQALKEFEEAISQLEENIATAKAAHQKAQTDKKAAEDELEEVTQAGIEDVAKVEAKLVQSQAGLQDELGLEQVTLANQKKANKEVMEALLDAQAVQRNQLDLEIKELKAANVQIQATLDKVLAKHAEIKAAHGA